MIPPYCKTYMNVLSFPLWAFGTAMSGPAIQVSLNFNQTQTGAWETEVTALETPGEQHEALGCCSWQVSGWCWLAS